MRISGWSSDVCSSDLQVGRGVGAQAALVGRAAGSEGVGEFAAAQAAAIRALLMRGFDAGQVGRARSAAARADAVGDGGDAGVEGHGSQVRVELRMLVSRIAPKIMGTSARAVAPPEW